MQEPFEQELAQESTALSFPAWLHQLEKFSNQAGLSLNKFGPGALWTAPVSPAQPERKHITWDHPFDLIHSAFLRIIEPLQLRLRERETTQDTSFSFIYLSFFLTNWDVGL